MCVGNSINPTRSDRIDEIVNDPSNCLNEVIDHDLVVFDGQCQYSEIQNYHKIHNKNSKLTCMHLNIHSIPSKIHEIKRMPMDFTRQHISVDVLLLCETFINELNKSQCHLDDYNLVEEHHANKSKGGVAIYVNKNYNLRKGMT